MKNPRIGRQVNMKDVSHLFSAERNGLEAKTPISLNGHEEIIPLGTCPFVNILQYLEAYPVGYALMHKIPRPSLRIVRFR